MAFVQTASSRFFPESVLIGGRIKYYSALDPLAAAESYRQAILAEPSLLDAWMALAQAEISLGHREEAERIYSIIAPTLSSISSWKWEELLLAFDLQDEKHFRTCFNYILSNLPHRAGETSSLGARYWGGWKEVLPRLSSSNYPVFLTQVMAAGEVDAALALWEKIEAENPDIDEKDRLQFCEFLIAHDRLREAKNIWKLWKRDDFSSITDGGFEFQPLNTAFGWRIPSNSDVIVERTTDEPYAGKSCLHLHFKGNANIDLNSVYQIVPVRPQTRYQLRFARKSRNLTTDRGVFVEISGYKCKGLSVSSQPILGTSPWAEEEMEFITPAGCEAVLLRVCRKESLKFDSKISGDYWLDAMELRTED
jgi:tetratricopeptide (TPR) repeat protein